MSVFTTFRTHPLAHASYLPRSGPGLVLGASGPVPAAALIVYGCLVTLPHANLRWTFGPLGRIVVSPAYHRLHHARTPLDARGAVNFGFVLVCWDRLAPPRRLPGPTGADTNGDRRRGRCLSSRPCGWSRTAGVVLAQLAQPFAVERGDGRRVMIAVPTRVRELSRQVSATPDTRCRPRRRPARGPDRPGLDLHLPRGARRCSAPSEARGCIPRPIFFATVAHLHPGGFFAAVAGVTELVGGAPSGSASSAGSPPWVSSWSWSWPWSP